MKILPSIANKILLEVKMSQPNFCERYLWPLISLKFSRDFFPFHLGQAKVRIQKEMDTLIDLVLVRQTKIRIQKERNTLVELILFQLIHPTEQKWLEKTKFLYGTKVGCQHDQIATPLFSRHSGRFVSKFSHNFKSNTRFELLRERGPRVNIGVKYSVEQY